MTTKRLLLFSVVTVLIIFTAAVLLIDQESDETEALNASHANCYVCHSLHGAPGQALANEAVVEVLCLSCHGPAGVATKKAEVHTNKSGSVYAAFTMGCMDCHNPHDNMANRFGGTNLDQVGKKLDASGDAMIPTPNSGNRYVVFESRGTDAGGPSMYSFADGDEDGNGYYDGVCETCHTQAANHRNNSSGGHAHYTGTNCIACHPHDENFHGSGGGCGGCHSSVKNGRRAVAGEFALTSHHVAGGAVTDDDCGVCHYEAQGDHMDGFVDLLNPDTGGRLTPFVSFTRNTASDSLESWVIEVQDNLCLKCHDSDGAMATNFSGNALQPFSSADRNVPNVFAQFDTGNSYHHAVRGAGNNPYCNTNTMEPPWNQGDHDVISCFDCHEAGGHGSSNQRMLRSPIDLVTMESVAVKGDLPSGMGVTVEAFCTRCHKSSEYVGGGSNSIFEFHGSNQNQHRANGGNELGCMGCHGGIVNMWHSKQGAAMPNGFGRGNLHGGNFTWTADSFSDGTPTEYFIVGGWNSGWQISGSTGYCRGGDCNHSNSSKNYTR
jgi:predicted CXXCH cytochrome family protein